MGLEKQQPEIIDNVDYPEPKEDDSDLVIGTKVRTRQYGLSDFAPGVVANDNKDGTFDIEISEDCVVYTSVMRDMIRIDVKRSDLVVGTRVIYSSNEDHRHKALILSMMLNGHFDIELDNGRKEMGVDPAC